MLLQHQEAVVDRLARHAVKCAPRQLGCFLLRACLRLGHLGLDLC